MQNIPWNILAPIVDQEYRVTAAANLDVACDQLCAARRILKQDGRDPFAVTQITALIAGLRAMRTAVRQRIRDHRHIPPSAN